MRLFPKIRSASYFVHTEALSTNISPQLTAPSDTEYAVVEWIRYSYDAAATGLIRVRNLTTAVTILEHSVTAPGPRGLNFPPGGIHGGPGDVLQLRLGDGGDGIEGKICFGASNMRLFPEQRAAATWSTDGPAADTDATGTVGPVATEYPVLDYVVYSYDIVPVGGLLTINVGGTDVLKLDITASGEDVLDFRHAPIYGALNEAIVVTLAAAGAAPDCKGKLTIRSR